MGDTFFPLWPCGLKSDQNGIEIIILRIYDPHVMLKSDQNGIEMEGWDETIERIFLVKIRPKWD